jgi:MFS family permease
MVQSRNIANLVASIATIASCDMAMGFTLQLLPLLMERNSVPAWVIGLNTAMSPLGILLAGPFLPRLIRYAGTRRVVYGSILFAIASLFLFKLLPSLWVWFPLRFMFGIAIGALFTVSEAWVMTFAGEGSRGRVMGLYTSVMAASFAMGPLMLPLTGTDGWLPWLIAACCLLVATIPLSFVTVDDSVFQDKDKGQFWPVVRTVPLLLFAVGCATLFDSVFISFFSIFGLRNGLSVETASLALGVGIFGNMLFQFIIGYLADKWSKRGVVLLSAMLTVLMSFALIWAVHTVALWPVVIILATSAFAVYVVALATVAETFQGGDLVACSAAFAVMWGIGGLVGPPLAGGAIDAFGINAMPVTLALFYLVLLSGLAFTGGRLVTRATLAYSSNT